MREEHFLKVLDVLGALERKAAEQSCPDILMEVAVALGTLRTYKFLIADDTPEPESGPRLSEETKQIIAEELSKEE